MSIKNGKFSKICKENRVFISSGVQQIEHNTSMAYTLVIISDSGTFEDALSNLIHATDDILDEYARFKGSLDDQDTIVGPSLVYVLINIAVYGSVKNRLQQFLNTKNGQISARAPCYGDSMVPNLIPNSMDVIISFCGWNAHVKEAVEIVSRFNDEPNPNHVSSYYFPAEGFSPIGDLPCIDGSCLNLPNYFPPPHSLYSILESTYKIVRRRNNQIQIQLADVEEEGEEEQEGQEEEEEEEEENVAGGGGEEEEGAVGGITDARVAGGGRASEEADLTEALARSQIDQ